MLGHFITFTLFIFLIIRVKFFSMCSMRPTFSCYLELNSQFPLLCSIFPIALTIFSVLQNLLIYYGYCLSSPASGCKFCYWIGGIFCFGHGYIYLKCLEQWLENNKCSVIFVISLTQTYMCGDVVKCWCWCWYSCGWHFLFNVCGSLLCPQIFINLDFLPNECLLILLE